MILDITLVWVMGWVLALFIPIWLVVVIGNWFLQSLLKQLQGKHSNHWW